MHRVAKFKDDGDMMWRRRPGEIIIKSVRNLNSEVGLERNVILYFVGSSRLAAKDDLATLSWDVGCDQR